jgi:hypothetical protein
VAYFVSEGAVTGDVIVEWDGYVDCFSDDIFQIAKFFEVVFCFDVFFVCGVHACEKTSDGGDSISFTDTEDGGVDVGCTGFESTVSICNRTTGIIVEMTFDIAGNDSSECSY